MTAPPPKIKAFLGTIKVSILDTEGSSADECYFALIKLELVQRGVIVADHQNLWEAVRSHAGKQLLDDTAAPKPLISGAAVMEGRVAELLASLLSSSAESDLNVIGTFPFVLEAMERCQQVDDQRLRVLLNIVTDSSPQSPILLSRRLLYIAEGCYYRAANFQTDAPPLWKRAWDAILLRQRLSRGNQDSQDVEKGSWESREALENLYRIADSKNNKKRVAELSLCLVEAALETEPMLQEEATNAMIASFVAPYRSIQPPSQSEAVEIASRYLKSANHEEVSSGDNFLRQMLELRLQLMQEEVLIQQAASTHHQAAKNRSTAATGVKSLASFLESARSKHLSELKCGTAIDVAADALRDSLLFEPDGVSIDRRSQACALIKQYLVRLKTQARCVAKSSTAETGKRQLWQRCARFIEPILAKWVFSDNEEKIEAQLALLSSNEMSMSGEVALLVPTVEWMNTAVHPETALISITATRIALQILRYVEMQSRKKIAGAAGVIQTKTSHEVADVGRIQCAVISLRVMLYLNDTKDGNNETLIRNITETALARGDDGVYSECSSAMGLAFLEFLVCWSGLHRVPWPFCTMTDARGLVLKARRSLSDATTDWGRSTSTFETLLLDLGQADAEVSTFSGGLVGDSRKLYLSVLENLRSREGNMKDFTERIMRSKCYSGLATLSVRNDITVHIEGLSSDETSPEALSRNNTENLSTINEVSTLFFWRSLEAGKACLKYQLASARQMLADILIRRGRQAEAEECLMQAVEESLLDADAACALGAFRLRMFFFGEVRSSDDGHFAQVQLLKAAKLDSSKSNPFALLGYWYEYVKDEKRSLGCYSKALMIDPWHPVAGRGILRLQEPEKLIKICGIASDSGSPLCGWAWITLGRHKAMVEGNDELAVVSFLAAGRCRDVENPTYDALSIFYVGPGAVRETSVQARPDLATSLAELAASYRRLGRFTAALRSCYSAIEAAGDAVLPSTLCSCAQIEMELGLFDEAAEKLLRAKETDDHEWKIVSNYGLCLCLLSTSRRDAQEGKYGTALQHLRLAVDICRRLSPAAGCVQKLLGDVHSFGALLPPDVFASLGSDIPAETSVRSQMAFVAMGVQAYQDAEAVVTGSSEDETNLLKACLASDSGCNILLQAQLLSGLDSQGIGLESDAAVELFEQSASEFRRALALYPAHAPAWCGLGCALITGHPLLAQHAFCRSLELDNQQPDSYANLSFLYTSFQRLDASSSVSDALTQVADTPMMWINRALIEQMRRLNNQSLEHAADAYRAALQAGALPLAKRGLGLTCRFGSDDIDSGRQESYLLLDEYNTATGATDLPCVLLGGMAAMELAFQRSSPEGRSNMSSSGRQQVVHAWDQLKLSSDVVDELLETEMIQKVLQETSVDVDDGQVDATNVTNLPPLARQVVNEPNRGDLWLAFAKELSLNSTTVAFDAFAAADQAVRILSQQASEPSLRVKGSHALPILASDLADALSLRYWLDSLNGPTPTAVTSVDLQKAILLSPNNRLVREILSVSSNS